MPLWRIRIRLSDDPHSRAQLDQALVGQQVKELTFESRALDSADVADVADGADMAGDVVLELPRDEDLGAMLNALHRISPQVFVSRANDDGTATGGPALTPQFRKNRMLVRRAAGARVRE
jgi:hypothetical protein